jgi:hypothetical protein
MFDSTVPAPLQQTYALLKNNKEMHRKGILRDSTYESLNRDCHLTVAAQAACSPQTRSFVYISAAAPNILNENLPWIQRYFSTKKETEEALAEFTPEQLRCVVLRPTVMYDDQHLHSLAPAAVSRVSNLLDRFVFSKLGFPEGVPHFLPTPPIFVDTVAECAVEAALNPGVNGILDVDDIALLAEEASNAEYLHNRGCSTSSDQSPVAQELASSMLAKMM